MAYSVIPGKALSALLPEPPPADVLRGLSVELKDAIVNLVDREGGNVEVAMRVSYLFALRQLRVYLEERPDVAAKFPLRTCVPLIVSSSKRAKGVDVTHGFIVPRVYETAPRSTIVAEDPDVGEFLCRAYYRATPNTHSLRRMFEPRGNALPCSLYVGARRCLQQPAARTPSAAAAGASGTAGGGRRPGFEDSARRLPRAPAAVPRGLQEMFDSGEDDDDANDADYVAGDDDCDDGRSDSGNGNDAGGDRGRGAGVGLDDHIAILRAWYNAYVDRDAVRARLEEVENQLAVVTRERDDARAAGGGDHARDVNNVRRERGALARDLAIVERDRNVTRRQLDDALRERDIALRERDVHAGTIVDLRHMVEMSQRLRAYDDAVGGKRAATKAAKTRRHSDQPIAEAEKDYPTCAKRNRAGNRLQRKSERSEASKA